MVTDTPDIPEPPKDAFWVFGYGSLMWSPGFDYTSCREARLFGYRRALCLRSYVYRGTRDFPGLVFGLDAGGSCVGRAFRVGRSSRLEAYEYLMAREMISGAYTPRWLTVQTAPGRVNALCFVVNRSHEQYVPSLTESQIVGCIKRARGRRGSNAEYFVNTCRHLEDLGVPIQGLARIRDQLTGR